MNAILFALLAITPLVAGHGYLASITVDGATYEGNTPSSNSVSSVIRMIDDIDPVKGADNQYLACGQNAQKAAKVASANPGSSVSFKWVNSAGGNWIHEVGPLMTYMASCGSGGCTSFDHSNAEWFKIEESGLRSDGTWAMADLAAGKSATITLPSNIKSGEYLIRHELLALHTAQALGGAEFYPACAQLSVGGSKTGTPDGTVSLPGAYSDTDPGILVDVYDLSGSYQFPGPAVSNLAGNTARDVVESAAVNSTAAQLPRRMSRVMRSVNFAQ
ncbi:glycoside hydrolase [Lentinus tigrinus ALCF2SS1-7]|uniref:lytic cellulose monooxygenase (C4-dehydrogenating) n=1 Tax=Lentinus tigrinus ALCF2SS1-6 TaxID=1328759 RepID=A0A5C2S3X0_9APHY|nr:glycoside hydrolase [Lentinus tigrinus ALCF2SS1-6]RPD72990.1 glycoside hydrolase [Lentinus tigrinus ALCF2SS1-7]